ncbi:secreted RxLR effector protein 161-like [Salvia splendens]|uniref:secreted RxLR effector protein 161-like n=1 Tax=Salvia splendens TaxID=180675 RepID=UPI001C262789|nr:secreted RxLR effector protein 161-like [Salvia splendens]
MLGAKIASVPLAAHFMLSKDLCPKIESEIKAMHKVPYSNAIGSVMYLMISTRPDIAYVVSCLSRYMANPGPVHWEALKWLLRYLKNTSKYGLCFSKHDQGVKLCGFVDSNYANDKDKRKSTTSWNTLWAVMKQQQTKALPMCSQCYNRMELENQSKLRTD